MENGRAVAVHAKTPDGDVRFATDHVISSMPVRHLVRAIAPPDATEILKAGESLKYRDFLVVALMLDQSDLFPDNWIYIHSADVVVGRIQNFNNWSQAMVPEEGKTCVGMEYFCFKGDGLWSTPDDELIALATKELDQLGLASAEAVFDGRVIRVPKAYPVYDGEYTDHLAKAREFIDPIENLHCVGRNGMHKYNNQDHSMLTAMLALENMRGANHDTWAVNTDFEYHETQKVEQRTPKSRERTVVEPRTAS
jgi:protoporphyrinogen oxidase